MMQESLFIDWSRHTDFENNEACLHSQIRCCKKARPNVAIARHQSALFIIKECFAVAASVKGTVNGEPCRKYGMKKGIPLHAVLVSLFQRQSHVALVRDAQNSMQYQMLYNEEEREENRHKNIAIKTELGSNIIGIAPSHLVQIYHFNYY